jgi:hypothetical protein
MKKYRATVYHLSSSAAAVDGDAGIRRFVTEEHASSVDDFKAQVRDRFLSDVDAEVSFGPVTEKK